jgi:hypothetical protein
VLEERKARLPVQHWEWGYVKPAQYLAKRLKTVLDEDMASCVQLRAWISGTCRLVVRKERKLRWIGPMDFPVELGRQHDQRQAVNSLTRGRRRWQAATNAVTADGLQRSRPPTARSPPTSSTALTRPSAMPSSAQLQTTALTC